VTTVLTPASPLTAADRCDRCGAQAYLRVVLLSGGELLFCAHHGRKFEPELKKIAAEIQDETERPPRPTGRGGRPLSSQGLLGPSAPRRGPQTPSAAHRGPTAPPAPYEHSPQARPPIILTTSEIRV
jgi:hypothetical protein